MVTQGSDLRVEPTSCTPLIHAVWQEGLLRIEGESYPENTFELFDDLIEWTELYLSSSSAPLALVLSLTYLNTSSIRAMIDVFDALEDSFSTGRDVSVRWYYDHRNPRAAELGEEFKEDYTFPFVITAEQP
ncbi:DUF1987 domain-containing protein [Synechococcus sp. RSCCF101]|uniref:biofilm regulation phosphoprotein SiaC n=1 Tax=Synechococcus sp. RSCCF101 TaxID=2511069 RepID=UPI001246C78A|nr:biofilm regulation phosphoprotein SiaC [Synechococcus sp. RSCCF101]QEY31849.1 DUF1987 domain-containing protein [Synechococcus sp. RSCCF101]